MNTAHDILRFDRDIDAPVSRVWDAYADIENRTQWSVPEGEDMVYDVAEFVTGGQDIYRCGPPGDLSNAGHHLYHLIEPRKRFLYTDTVRRDGELMAVAVLLWELEALEGNRTRVTVVDQVTSLVGPGMIDGHRDGHNKTLDRMLRWIA